MNDEVDRTSAVIASWPVRAADVAGLRRRVLDAAALVGLDADRAGQFTFAVNEVVINAIRHGGGTATVDVAADPDRAEITVTVTDTGPGYDAGVAPELPGVDQLHGRGLWLVRRMCDDVVVDSSDRGTVVRLRAFAHTHP